METQIQTLEVLREISESLGFIVTFTFLGFGFVIILLVILVMNSKR